MTKYDREKLYEAVWSTPMQKLAKQLRDLRRGFGQGVLETHGPTARGGFWAKKAAGKPGDDGPVASIYRDSLGRSVKGILDTMQPSLDQLIQITRTLAHDYDFVRV